MNHEEVATLGGGCFWCLEAAYNQTRGVSSAISGYMGGLRPDPSYEEVCTGRSGHVEVVQVTFDPAVISYRDIVHIYFSLHDPTTLNRQGNDVGTQYRSVIYTHSPEQDAAAKEVIQEVSDEKIFDNPIVTTVERAPAFYAAEAYHQRYFEKNPNQPYCAYIVGPKVAKFRSKYTALLK